MTNAQILMFIMGQQGGTVHQLAKDLQVGVDDILHASEEKMQELCRKAQAFYWREHKGDINKLLFKHLTMCVGHLKADYDGHDLPHWLERAAGVQKILSEYISIDAYIIPA